MRNFNKTSDSIFLQIKEDKINTSLSLRKNKINELLGKKRAQNIQKNTNENYNMQREESQSESSVETNKNYNTIAVLLNSDNQENYLNAIDKVISLTFLSNEMTYQISKEDTFNIILNKSFTMFKDNETINQKTIMLIGSILLLEDSLNENSIIKVFEKLKEIINNQISIKESDYKSIVFWDIFLIIKNYLHTAIKESEVKLIYQKSLYELYLLLEHSINDPNDKNLLLILMTLLNTLIKENGFLIENENNYNNITCFLSSLILICKSIFKLTPRDISNDFSIISIASHVFGIISSIFSFSDNKVSEIVSIYPKIIEFIEESLLILSQFSDINNKMACSFINIIFNISTANINQFNRFFINISSNIFSSVLITSSNVFEKLIELLSNIFKNSLLDAWVDYFQKNDLWEIIERGIFTNDKNIQKKVLLLIIDIFSRLNSEQSKYMIKNLDKHNVISKIESIYINKERDELYQYSNNIIGFIEDRKLLNIEDSNKI